MAIREKATTDVEVNGQNAATVLDNLKSKADGYRRAMVEANKANNLAGYKKAEAELKKTERTMNQLKKATFDVNTVMKNLSTTSLNDLTRAQRQLQTELKKTTRGTTDYITKSKQLRSVSGEIKKVRSEMNGAAGAQQGWLGKANGFFNKWGGWMIGAAAGITGLSLGLKKLATDANEFESRLANLSALTGLSGSSLDYLAEQAKKLSVGVTDDGVRITKSANDIIDAFTLMGSAKPELLKNKEALTQVTTEALKLAEAAKMDTKTAVESLANVMNQFGAGADEASKYINVLAAGSKEGAAAVDSIAASIIKFGPAAASANISVEESVGLIETLAEKGVKGEVAGTQLRTALLKLQTGADEFNPKVVGLNQALENLSNANLSAGDMVKLFGQEAYMAGAILIKNKDQVDKYTKAVTGTNVATEQAVKNTQTMAARLEQARNKMKLATLELGQKLGGALVYSTNMVRKFINVIIKANDVFTRWRKGVPQSFSDAAIKIKDEQVEVSRLVMRLTDANTQESERRKIVKELNEISPTLVKNLDAENLSLEQLKINLKAYNEEATNRIILANLQAEEEKELAQLADARQKVAEAQVRLQEVFLQANEDIALSQGTFNEKLQATTKYLQEQVSIQEKEGKLGDVMVTRAGNIVDYRTKEQKLLQNILDYNTSLVTSQEELSGIESKTMDYQSRINALKEILGLNKQISSTPPEPAATPTDDSSPSSPKSEESKYQKMLAALNKYNEEKRLAIHQDYLNGKLTKEQFNGELETLELAHLEAILALQKEYGEETYDTELKIAQKRIDVLEKFRSEQLAISESLLDESLKATYEAIDAEIAAWEKAEQEKEQMAADALARRIQELNEYKAISDQLASSMGATIGQFITDTEMSQEEFARNVVMSFLDMTHNIVRMAIAQIWAQAMASVQSGATFGAAGVYQAMALSAVVEAVFAGVKAAVSQRAGGKYDVIGAEDGRTYRNVPFKGTMKTGVYSTPTLVAERGPELVVDAGTLRNLQVNFPDVLPKVRAAMVPQHATGNVATNPATASAATDPELKALIAQQNAIIASLNMQLKEGIHARMSYDHFKTQTEKAQRIENATNRAS